MEWLRKSRRVERYFVVRLMDLNDSAEEWVSEHSFNWGALGVSEVLPFEQPEGEEDVFTRIPEKRTVDVYFGESPPAGFLETLRARFPEARASVTDEENRDWLAEWKKGFKPFALIDGHWVVPSWCEPPPQAKHKIWIDPGMAFGTGTHETTQLVAQAMLRICAGGNVPREMLDVGTGTGILAILGRQLGIAHVDSTEIEEDSRRVAKENFALNDCATIRLDERQVEDLKENYDLVVANIIDGVLVRIQDALKARVRPGGWLLLSGIIGERENDFLIGFRLPGGKNWDFQARQGDWLLYAVRL